MGDGYRPLADDAVPTTQPRQARTRQMRHGPCLHDDCRPHAVEWSPPRATRASFWQLADRFEDEIRRAGIEVGTGVVLVVGWSDRDKREVVVDRYPIDVPNRV